MERFFKCPQSGRTRDLVAERKAYDRRAAAIRGAANDQREREIMRICSRYELESDEFITREEKALRYLNQ